MKSSQLWEKIITGHCPYKRTCHFYVLAAQWVEPSKWIEIFCEGKRSNWRECFSFGEREERRSGKNERT